MRENFGSITRFKPRLYRAGNAIRFYSERMATIG
jgi:hypothetical protein